MTLVLEFTTTLGTTMKFNIPNVRTDLADMPGAVAMLGEGIISSNAIVTPDGQVKLAALTKAYYQYGQVEDV